MAKDEASSTRKPGTIVVGGTGRVAVEPDVADLQLGVSIARPTVDAARTDAATAMTSILAAIRGRASPSATSGRRSSRSSRATTIATDGRRS